MADIAINSMFLLDVCLVEEIHQFFRRYLLSEGHEVNVNFIDNIFICKQ